MLSNVSAALQRFFARFASEEGQALAEYGLIIALVAVALIGALGLLALGISGTFDSIIGAMPGGGS
jgi:pilus assembly protein Flp/PilA